jgi:GNAT superfamily N-acetyltransferase
MHVRRATSEDLLLLPEIEVRAGERFREVGLPDIADAAPPTIAELEEAAAILVAADDGGEVVGYARLELLDGAPHLEQLSVRPESGGQGAGTALLEAAAEWAGALSASQITLTTFRDVPFNAPYYARRGYEEVPEAAWTPALRALVDEEAAHGLDPAQRVVMARPVGPPTVDP